MLKGQPKGLFVLALANMGERFGYYTMLAIFVLYMQAKFGLTTDETSTIFGVFLAAVYFLPLIGGLVADKWLGYGKTITLGIVIMFSGYLLLAYPTTSDVAIVLMFAALSLIALGTGFFKGNLQALVGNLYDDPKYSKKRDLAFSVFYMCINIGAFFAPSAAQAVSDYFMQKDGYSYNANVPALYHQLNRGEISLNAYVNLAGYAKGQNILVVDTAMMEKYSQNQSQEILMDTVGSPLVADSSAAVESYVTLESRFGRVLNQEQLDRTNVLMDSLIKRNFGFFVAQSSIPVDQIKSAVLNTFEPFADSAAVYSALKSQLINGASLIGSKESSIDSDLEKKYDPKKSSLKKYIDGLLQSAINAQIAPMVNREQMLQFAAAYTVSMSTSFNYSFAVACFSLVISILIFLIFRRFYAAANKTERERLADIASGKTSQNNVVTLTAKQTKDRMVALGLVFAVVIFFWMAFHQNGLTMTFFARDYTQTSVSGFDRFGFSLLTLLPFAVCFYGVLNIFQSKKGSSRGIAVAVAVVGGALAYWAYSSFPASMSITPQIFQQFNAFFIVILTPLSIAFFSWLNSKGKEPLAPRKIGIGMIIAALGFVVLALGSIGLPTPSAVEADGGLAADMLVSPNWLISTYFILTIAELFLSPMGISFVSKVAPPKYKGMAQGGWLAATAVGNYLVAVVGYLWGGLELWLVWGILVTLCLLSATFLFSQMKKLERTTREA